MSTTVSFAVTGQTGADIMSGTLSGTRKLAAQVEETLAAKAPAEEDCGPRLQWTSVDHWEEATTSKLMALGAAMAEANQLRTANRCYSRAYDIARQPAPPRKNPFDPDPEPPRRAKWWPTEVLCRSALCAGKAGLVVAADPTMLAKGTVSAVREQLALLDALSKETAEKAAAEPSHSWLLYNVSTRTYAVLLDALQRGLSGPALAGLMAPLLWVAAAVDATPALCTAPYCGWRVQLATVVCRAFEAIGQPSHALRFCMRLAKRLQSVDAADSGAAAVSGATATLAVVRYRYDACADPAAAKTELGEFEDVGTRFAAIVEGLTGMATPQDAAREGGGGGAEEEEEEEEGETERVVPSLSTPATRQRALSRVAPDEAVAAAVGDLLAAGRALAAEHFPATEPHEEGEGKEEHAADSSRGATHSCTDAGRSISLDAHGALVKWCFAFADDEAFHELVPALRWRLMSEAGGDQEILALELEVMAELIQCFDGSVFQPVGAPVAFADALYALAEAQARSPIIGCSDLIYDGAVLLWDALKDMPVRAEETTQSDAVDDAEGGDGGAQLKGGAMCHCLLVAWKCLTIARADDPLLCSTVALRLATAWEASSVGDADVLQLAIEVAERGLSQLEDARSKYIEGRDVGWVLTASRADGDDELYQRLCCVHVELVNKMFQLKLLQGRERARAAAERGYMKSMAALRKRQGLQPLYGMRTAKQAEAESLALSRPAPRPSFDPRTERELTNYCGQNIYQQALLLGQMARFRDTAAERAPLLKQAAELLVTAQRKESLASEHWQDVASEAKQSSSKTKVPVAPILISRTHTSVTLMAPEFKLMKSSRSWALYGKEAGAGTACAMTNTELDETGKVRDVATLGPVTVTGLRPNEAYVFATAAFGANKKVVQGIGLTTVPIVAMHPLPVQLCQGYISVLAFELGCATPAKQALAPLRSAFIVPSPRLAPPGVSEPGRSACKLPGIDLDREVALRSSHATLRAFCQALLLSVAPPGVEVARYVVTRPPKNKEARELAQGPQAPQLATLDNVRTLLVSLDVATSIHDDELTMQVAVTLYEFVAPVADAYQRPLYLLPALARGLEALANVPSTSLCPSSDANDEVAATALAARKTLCAFAYQLLTMSTDSIGTAKTVVAQTQRIVRDSVASWAPPEPAEDNDAAFPLVSPWAIDECDALLAYMLVLPKEITGDDLGELASIRGEGAGERDAQIADMWAHFRASGPASAIDTARTIADGNQAVFFRHASAICSTALQKSMVSDAKEACATVLAEATSSDKCVDLGGPRELYERPDIQVHVEEGEEAAAEELDDDAKAAAAEAQKAEEQRLEDEAAASGLHVDFLRTTAKPIGARAANFIIAALTKLHAIKAAQRMVRKKISSEIPWRANLILTLARAEFIEWRDSGANPGHLPDDESEDRDAGDGAAETPTEPLPWLGCLQHAARAVVLASRAGNWVHTENACRTFQNLAVWMRQHLPAAAGVDDQLGKLAKEIASNCVHMLYVMKQDSDRQLEEEAIAAAAGGKSAVTSTSKSSTQYWFTGLTSPNVAWVAQNVVWCLRLCKGCGAISDMAGRLNYVTEDCFAEEILPMIINAKQALGEEAQHAKERYDIVLRDKPMAKEMLDLARDEMHKHARNVNHHPQVLSKFTSTIQLLRDKRETLLMCQALNELGDFHWAAGRGEEAAVAWADGVDGAFGVFGSIKEWRDVLGGQDGAESVDADLLKRYGIFECLLAITMLAKLAKYIHTHDVLLRVECCRFAARVVYIMFSSDVSHPHKLREFSRYRLRQLWEGVDVFSVPTICASTVFMEALETISTELETAGVLLPILPVLCLYQHVATDALGNLVHSLRCGIIRTRVLTAAGYLKEASQTLNDIATGAELPGVEALERCEGIALLHSELPPQSDDNTAAIDSACSAVLPQLTPTLLSDSDRDYIECGLTVAQELLRLRLATSTPEDQEQAREQLLSAAEAKVKELRDSRTGTTSEEEGADGTVAFSPLDTWTRCEAELALATIYERRLLYKDALTQAYTVMAFIQARDKAADSDSILPVDLSHIQRTNIGSAVWFRCRLLVVRCHTASRRFDDARQACAVLIEEASQVNDVVSSCEATAASAAIDALCGDAAAAQAALEAVATRLKKCNLLEQLYGEVLVRLAELNDKAGRPGVAKDLLMQADAVVKSLATGDDGTAGFGVMEGAAPSLPSLADTTCASAAATDLPLRHSLYLPPALLWARVHSALGHLASAQADTAAADAHLAFAAFVTSTGVCAAPPRFRAALCLALGRQSRKKICAPSACGGAFTPEEDAPDADGAGESPDTVQHLLLERAASQLAAAIEIAVGQSGHQHSIIREALLELAILHGQQTASAAELRTAAHLLRRAADVASMESAVTKLMTAVPSAAAVSNIPEFVAADLVSSRQADDAGSPEDRPVTTTELVEYYVSCVADQETAGLGSGLDVSAKLARVHKFVLSACPSIAAACLTGWPEAETSSSVGEGLVCMQWCAADPSLPDLRAIRKHSDDEEDQPKLSLAARLGLPGSTPPAVQVPANKPTNIQLFWAVGHLPADEESDEPEDGEKSAYLGCLSVPRAEVERLHTNFGDLLHQLREDQLLVEDDDTEDRESDGKRLQITQTFFAECVSDLRQLWNSEPSDDYKPNMSIEVVTALETLLDTGAGGAEVTNVELRSLLAFPPFGSERRSGGGGDV